MMQSLEREHTPSSDSTLLTLPATRLLTRVKSLHNPAKHILGLLRENRDAEGAAGPGECELGGARRICMELETERAGSMSAEHKVR